jgi:hypothetical protein
MEDRSRRRAVVVLNPSQSKRLIARAVAQLPEVQLAHRRGRLIIGNGTTNAFVAEELLGQPVPKWRYAAGVIANGRLEVTDGATRLQPVAFKQGEPYPEGWVKLLQEFDRDDVFIKGGNALDPEGNVGVLLASPTGGTVGQIAGILAARGSRLIVPIGLEKLVPDVVEAARHCGTGATDWTDGLPSGMAVLHTAQVVTELEAFENLFGVEAWHIASGGVSGSEGAVTIALEGPVASVKRAFGFAESLSGEPPVTAA